MNTETYFKNFEKEVREVYALAETARQKGLDPAAKVEISLARSLAEKVVGLISLVYPQIESSKISSRILELEREYGKLDPAVSFKIAEEVAKQKFCNFSSLSEAIDAGIRIGFAYTTLGVVSSPIEGYTRFEIKKTREGKDYFSAFFSGPIRSAGTTASCVVLMLIDYLREMFGYAKYDPSKDEIKRYVTENNDYHEKITNLQYMPTDEEIEFLARNIPIQIDGESTEKIEVSNYKNLPRVHTNQIRGGMCLIFSEGLAQKAAKGFRVLKNLKEKGFKSTGWDFLEEYIKLHEKRDTGKTESSPTYINDLVAGRPVFGHPSRSGAFRFRYGRGRTSGFSAASVHPATMAITDNFIAIGTQLKIEKPTKGMVATSCDSIDGPVVRLSNGSVRKINTKDEAKKLYPDVREIIYLGDLLFPLSDVKNRNSCLVKPGYVEEWWKLELLEKEPGAGKNTDVFNLEFEQAIEISRKYKIPLHPRFIFYWTEISKEEFLGLILWLKSSRISRKIILPYNKSESERFKLGKRALELLGAEHEVTIENVVLNKESSRALLCNLGIDFNVLEQEDYLPEKEFSELMLEADKLIMSNLNAPENNIREGEIILSAINKLSFPLVIKDKAGDFVGARMGRPEKAKLRKLTGSPNVLFPVGREGGRLRSLQEACSVGSIRNAFPLFYCENCRKDSIYNSCEQCGKQTKKMFYCYECGGKSFQKCDKHQKSSPFSSQSLDINYYFAKAAEKLKLANGEIPALIKGVRGTSSGEHIVENLSKGILRAIHNLQVNKDGTIRFDATELPLISFKPKEVSVSVDKLREMGYTEDISGKKLSNEEQILELKPHDIVLPCSLESMDERADDVFIRIAGFVDELLVRFYEIEPFYNIKKRGDLVGHLGVCMAPHNCAGVICRIIGFSNTQGLLASPYMHAAMRRDCVYPTTKFFFYNEDNKEIFYDSIGDYVEKIIKQGAKTKKIDSSGTLSVENDKNIFALGIDPHTHEMKKKRIKFFIKGPKSKEWVKVTTATNREYIMTPTHKFMFIEDDKFKFKDAREIKKDDKLPILENFNLDFKGREINLIKLFHKKLSEEETKNFFVIRENSKEKLDKFISSNDLEKADYRKLKLRHSFSRHEIPAIIPIDKNLMRFLGYYIAEGYSRINKRVAQVAFRICNKKTQEHIVELSRDIFGIEPNSAEDNTKITLCSKLVYYFLKSLEIGRGAYDKRVPKLVFGLNNNLAKEFISSYFEGDGSVIKGKNIVFYSVSRDLLDDIALVLTKFRVIGRYFRTGLREPGKKVLERYKELGKIPKKHVLNHLVFGVYDSFKLMKILNIINKEKIKSFNVSEPVEIRYLRYNNKQIPLVAKSDYVEDCVKDVKIVKDEKNSYCVEVDWDEKEDRNVLWGEQIINTRCDGDEAAIMLLADVLLNFSRKFLPSHRGGTQDAPLVLNAKIDAGEVDEQILDFEMVENFEYPLELYRLAEQRKHSSEIKISTVKSALKEGKNPFLNLGHTHQTSDFNEGVVCSSYKLLGTMQEKVQHQMGLVEKIRAADAPDTARLILERHFLKDMRGNLRRFSSQEFRCVNCNEILRRPPLSGICPVCRGKIIFTINEGGIKKYMELALYLAEKYNLSPYIKQSLELTKRYIDGIFGKEPEQQEALAKWF